MSHHKFFRKGQPGSGIVVPPADLVLVSTNTQTGTNTTTHSLTGVPAGALIVLSTTGQDANVNPIVSSSPSLTWTKRADADNPTPGAEIHTAVFSAGGSISVSSNWGVGRVQTSVTYVFTGQETTLGGASAIATNQSTSSVPISTTKTNSVIITASSNWNTTTALTYRLNPVKVLEFIDPLHGTFAHYYYNAATVAQYTVGYSAPVDVDSGTSTAVYEVRSGTGGGGPGPDTTSPSAPVLNSPGKTNVSVGLQWTAAVDPESGIEGYTVYRGATATTVTTEVGSTSGGLTFTATGLTAGTTYFFRVLAINTVGLSTYSNTIQVTTDTVTTTTTTTTTTTQIGPTTTTTTTTFINNNPFTFTANPDDYSRYWGGSELWSAATGAVSGIPDPMHRYRRFTWCDLEGNTQGDWRFKVSGNHFRDYLDQCVAGKKLMSWGLMTVYPELTAGVNQNYYDGVQIGNSVAAYPSYLNTLMANDGRPAWVSSLGNHWVPNFNAPSYATRLLALYTEMYNWMSTTNSAAGVPYIHAMGVIDIRAFGSWGEWHQNATVLNNSFRGTSCDSNDINSSNKWDPGNGTCGNGVLPQHGYKKMFVDGTPTAADNNTSHEGSWPSFTRIKEIIDAHKNGFPTVQLNCMLAAFDANFNSFGTIYGTGWENTLMHTKIGRYILDNGNAFGPIGWRRDQWGQSDGYFLLPANTSGALVTSNDATNINKRYLIAPVTGEPPGGGYNMTTLPSEITTLHGTMVGNGNYGSTTPDAASVQQAAKIAGCILRLVNGGGTNLTTQTFGITTNWQNFGQTPQFKKNWAVTFELRQNGSLKWSGVSTLNLYDLKGTYGVSGATYTPHSDSFPRPALGAGQYELSVVIRDPNGYMDNLQLGINGRQANGSYILSTVTF